MKKIILIAALCACIAGTSFAQSNWNKVFLGAAEFSIAQHKIPDSQTIDCHGIGLDLQYISSNKNNGFAFILKEGAGVDWTDDFIKDENDFGAYANTYAGLGFAPIQTDKSLLALTAGLEVNMYNYEFERKTFEASVVGIDFAVGVDMAFTYKLSKRFGIGFNLLGTYSFAGLQLVDNDPNDNVKSNDDDVDVHYLKGGAWSIVPSVGLTFYL